MDSQEMRMVNSYRDENGDRQAHNGGLACMILMVLVLEMFAIRSIDGRGIRMHAIISRHTIS